MEKSWKIIVEKEWSPCKILLERSQVRAVANFDKDFIPSFMPSGENKSPNRSIVILAVKMNQKQKSVYTSAILAT